MVRDAEFARPWWLCAARGRSSAGERVEEGSSLGGMSTASTSLISRKLRSRSLSLSACS